MSEVSAADKPDFVLRETQSSTLRTFGVAGGVTQFLNSQGREVAAGPGAQGGRTGPNDECPNGVPVRELLSALSEGTSRGTPFC